MIAGICKKCGDPIDDSTGGYVTSNAGDMYHVQSIGYDDREDGTVIEIKTGKACYGGE